MDIDEVVEELTETIREAIDSPMGVEEAIEVLEGVEVNLSATLNGLRDDLKRQQG